MAQRLLPFHTQVDPYAEINLYALEDAYVNNSISGTGFGDMGVFVTVSAGDLNLDPVSFSSDSYMGKTAYNGLGYNQRSSTTLKIKPAASGDNLLGITLYETALYDEHGDNLSRKHQKVVENQVILKGDPVPVATRGQFTLSSAAVDGTISAGGAFKLSTTSGKITGCTYTDGAKIGTVLGTGTRGVGGMYADGYSGAYYHVKLG